MNINFIKPVQFNETLTAKGKVVKAGRSIVVAEAEAYNDKGDKVAIGRGTFYVIDTLFNMMINFQDIIFYIGDFIGHQFNLAR